MTTLQTKWAADHDWFVCVTPEGNGVVVLDAYTKDGKLHQDTRCFTDFLTLYRWAGY